MTLQITAVNGRPRPVDVDPTEPLLVTFTGADDPGAFVDIAVSATAAAGVGGESVWHDRQPLGTGHLRLDRITLVGEQVYQVRATVGAHTTTTVFRTAPAHPWPQAESIWAPAKPDGQQPSWCLLRTEFDLPAKPVSWATLYATASSPEPYRQYVHVSRINGDIVGSGPTRSIADEVRFDGFDVTGFLRPGRNAIAVTAGTSQDHRFLSRLVIVFADGERISVGSDRSWRSFPLDELVHPAGDIGSVCYRLPAENLDLAQFPWGYDEPDFDDSAWQPAAVRPPFGELVPTPTQKVEHVTVRPQSVTSRGDRLIIDFGRTWLGGVALRTRDTTGPITIRYAERLRDDGTVQHELQTGNVYEETLTADGQDRVWQPWGMRVFRYVEIYGLRSVPIRDDIAAVAQIYPLDPTLAAFSSSDPVLDQVWQLAAHSIRALNGNLYVDSWTRERLAYEADIYIQQRAHLCLQPDPSLGRYSLAYIARNRTWPTEWPFYTVLAVHDEWRRTADTAPAELIFDRLLQLLPDRYLHPTTGLITKDPGQNSGQDGDLVDWPPVERNGFLFGPVNTVINALAATAYRAAGELAEAIGRPEADRLVRTAELISSAMISNLYDAGLGAFVDGLDANGNRLDHHSVHASAFAVWAGIVDGEQADRVAGYIERQGLSCSVYTAAFVVDALFTSGHGDAAVELLTGTGRRSWANMITLGAGATMEAWDEVIKPNLSHSHPWGASPAYLAFEGVLGIRPLSPGYRRFAVRPQLGRLDRASGVLPTSGGAIAVEAERRGDRIRIDLGVPDGLVAEICDEDGRVAERVGPGRHRVHVRRR